MGAELPEEELPYPLPHPGGGKKDLYYIVKIKPEQDYVTAYDKKEVLQSGMRVDAKAWIDRRPIIERMFEPFFIVAGKAS